jgi:hypothetical protein
MAKHLTNEQLEKLASRKNVKRIAVENFLSSLQLDGRGPYGDRGNAEANLSSDAQAYGWNSATVRAIRDGINMIFSRGAQWS